MNDRDQNYVLYGVREVIPSEAAHLERTISALEKALTENHGLTFDLSKSLIETTCKTIIKDRGESYTGKEKLPALIKTTLHLVCKTTQPVDEPSQTKDALKNVINGIVTSIQGVCELRRLYGEASHGRDAYFSQLGIDHAMMVARSADVISSYLFRMHRSLPISQVNERLSYGAYSDFNEWVDDQNDTIRIFDLEYKPSEVLFNIDHDAYRDNLIDYESDRSFQEELEENDTEGSIGDE